MAEGSVIDREATLDEDQAEKSEKKKQDEMQPGPGDAQVLWQRGLKGIGGDCRGNGGGEADGVAGQRGLGRSRKRLGRIGTGLNRKWRRRVRIGGMRRVIVEETQGFPWRSVFGQPAASAAATSGISSSWWPVMA